LTHEGQWTYLEGKVALAGGRSAKDGDIDGTGHSPEADGAVAGMLVSRAVSVWVVVVVVMSGRVGAPTAPTPVVMGEAEETEGRGAGGLSWHWGGDEGVC
jgi:hypothetical protein